ncbi:hypothetical protein CASFOL_009297 [Castilleja foliolosa]|uniref:Ubiquitin-like protease family profile domain-containing protein n=1 Tax=Castilleja foliolosa TaxID=1961234 RepID=A0ABD3DWX7_9LAMI
MASLQEEHFNRVRYEAAAGRKRPAQPSIPAHVEAEKQPKKRGRPRAAPPTRRTSVSTSGPVDVEAGKKKRRKGARKAQANSPSRQTSTSTADAIPESTTSTGLWMLEPPPTQMPESTSVPEWTWRWGEPWTKEQLSKARLNCLRKFKLLGIIKEQLSKLNALERFEESVFGHFLRFDLNAYHNGKVLLALLGREVTVSGAAECERWYRFGGRNNRFGKVEYAAITGLRFGASDFNPDSSDHLPYENGVYRLHFDGTSVYGDDLFDKFEECYFTEPEEAVKVALVLFAHFFFFAADGRTTIPLWLWTLVEMEEQFADFPWGSYTFQRLSHYLTAIHPPNPDKSDYQPNIYAYLMPLQLWAYETIPIFAQEGGTKTGDNGIPRAVRWKCPKNNWNRINELDRDDLMITTMEVTEEEMAAPYMHAIDIQISDGVQYIHRETWISSCPPLKKSAVTVQPKGRSKKRLSKISKCKGDPTPGEGEGSGERVGTAHGVGTSGDVGSRGAVGDGATDEPSPSVLESMNRAVSSAVSHALPGALREALNVTLPVLLPALVERAIQSVLPGIISDAVRQAVDSSIPGAVEQVVELFRRHEDKGFPDVDERAGEWTDPFIREEPAAVSDDEEPTENVQDKAIPDVDEQEYGGTDPLIHEEPAGKWFLGKSNSFWDPKNKFLGSKKETDTGDKKLFLDKKQFLGMKSASKKQFVDGDKEPTENVQGKAIPDVDEQASEGTDPFIHEEPAGNVCVVSGDKKLFVDKKQFLGKKSASKKQFVDGDKELTENVGNVGFLTPKEPRPKRLKLKSRFRLTPFVDCMDKDRQKSLKATFAKWRRQVNAKEIDVGTNSKYLVGPEYFAEIEKARTHLSTTSGVRLRPGMSLETLNIQDSSFYGHLVNAWNKLHPPNVECCRVDYAEWDVPTILINYVKGSLPRWGQPWSTNSNVVLVCNVEQHWVVCLLRIDDWEITLFDSMPSPLRVRQLEPLSRLVPYVIAKAGYFDAKSVAPRFDLMPVVSVQKDDDLIQGDVHSCGVFACMYIERMIACDFPQSSAISNVQEYRGKMALEIFAHSYE